MVFFCKGTEGLSGIGNNILFKVAMNDYFKLGVCTYPRYSRYGNPLSDALAENFMHLCGLDWPVAQLKAHFAK